MKKWIKLTKKKVGRRKVGEVFQASSSDARVLTAVGLAVEVDPPSEPKKKKRKTYKRRDAKPSARTVLLAEDDDTA